MKDDISSENRKQLSIIVPHFNSFDSLDKLLKTIPRSSEIEVFVIDDKSDDQVAYERLKKTYEFSNVTFLKNEKAKKGAGGCRNIGLQYASGNWLIFADADDYFIEGFYRIISRYFSSSFDVVFFTPISEDLITGNTSDRHVSYEQIIENRLLLGDKKSELAIRYEFCVPWSKMIKRELVVANNIQFDEIIASNDIMFSTKIGYVMDNFEASKKVIYCVTKGKGTLTKTMNEEVFFSRLEALVDKSNYLKERLDKESYATMSISGGGMIANCVLYKLGMRNLFKTFLILKRNHVSISKNLSISPIELYKKISWQIRRVRQEKKYHK